MEEEEEEKEVIQDQILITPEIMELILGNLDVKRLEICRLVCKCWNLEICRYLRRRVTVPLHVKNSKVYLAFYKLLKEGARLNLPRPFEEMSLRLPAHKIWRIKKYLFSNNNNSGEASPRIVVNKLSIWEYWDYPLKDPKDLVDLLNLCAPTLTHLRLGLLNPTIAYLNAADARLDLPELKAFAGIQIEATQVQKAVQLYSKILETCSKVVDLTLRGRKLTTGILASTDLRNIHRLSIRASNSGPVCASLAQLPLERLKCLKLDLSSVLSTEEVLPVLIHFSESLETLKLRGTRAYRNTLLEESFPFCPKLEVLSIDRLRIGGPLLSKCPRVKKLFMDSAYASRHFIDVDTMPKIRQVQALAFLDIFYSPSFFQAPGENTLVLLLFQILCQFPSVQSISIPFHFVKRFVEFLSTEEMPVARRIEKLEIVLLPPVPEPEEMKQLFSNLRFFSGLKHLGFSCSEYEDNIPFCDDYFDFSHCRLLESFSLIWVSSFRVDSIAEKLRHLKRVSVRNCCRRKFAAEMETLFTTLPNVVCGCELRFFD